MKYLKSRKDLIFIVNPILVAMGVAFTLTIPAILITFFRVFWIAIFFALFFIVTRHGKKRLAHNEDDVALKMPFFPWFLNIILVELCLLGMYLGISVVCGELLPVNVATHSHLFLNTLTQQLLNNGLFPFAIFALITVGMGTLAYNKRENAYFSALLKPITHHDVQQTLGLIINTTMRRATMMSLSVLLFFMMLLMISLILPPDIHLPHGFQPIALLVTLIIFFFIHTKIAKHYIAKLFSRHIPTLISFPLFCAGLAFIILFITAITGATAQTLTPQPAPEFIQHWIQFNWQHTWTLFSNVFFLMLTPLLCAHFTQLSRGYRVRSVMLGVLVLPVGLVIFILLSSALHWPMMVLSLHTIKIISLISFFILLPLLCNHRQSSYAILAYFPKEGAIKTRDHQPFFKRVAQWTVIYFYFYLVIGMNGLGLFLFVSNFFVTIILLLAIACSPLLEN